VSAWRAEEAARKHRVGEYEVTASDLYSDLLGNLTDSRSIMLSAEWQASLDQSTAATRVAAGRQLIALQGAILALSNASLTDIAEQMQKNEVDLTCCTDGLTQALKDLSKVQSILDSIAKVLEVVAKIVPLL
jgi:hypothetical protein